MSDLLSTIDGILKEDYRPKMVDVLNNDDEIGKKFTKDTEQYNGDGRRVVYPVHLERNQGVGSIGENENLPSPGSIGYADVTAYYKYSYARLRFSIQAIKSTKSNKGSFARYLTSAMEDSINSLMRTRQRMMFGYGVGILARVNGVHAAGDTVINLKHRGGVAGHTGVSLVGGATLIPKNAYIAFVRNATPTSATDSDIIAVKKVSSVASNQASVTLSATAGAQLNDNDMVILAPAGADITTVCSVNKEPMGLLGIIDDSTYLTTLHGISRSTYEQYKSSVIPLNGDFDLDVLQRAYDLADEKSGGQITDLYAHASVVREYEKVMQTIKRFVNEGTMKPDAGFKNGGKTITWSDLPFKKNRFAPYSTIFGVDFRSAVRFVNCEGEWADETGSTMRAVADKDTYESTFRVFDQYHIDRPDACFRIDGVKATVDVTPVE